MDGLSGRGVVGLSEPATSRSRGLVVRQPEGMPHGWTGRGLEIFLSPSLGTFRQSAFVQICQGVPSGQQWLVSKSWQWNFFTFTEGLWYQPMFASHGYGYAHEP